MSSRGRSQIKGERWKYLKEILNLRYEECDRRGHLNPVGAGICTSCYRRLDYKVRSQEELMSEAREKGLDDFEIGLFLKSARKEENNKRVADRNKGILILAEEEGIWSSYKDEKSLER